MTLSTMRLLSLHVERFKAFLRPQRLELRPLTSLIGRNSSGKSALARLPLLLKRSFSDKAEATVELEVDGVDFGASFLDLIHNRRPHGSIVLGAGFQADDGATVDLEVVVQNYDDLRLQNIAEWRLTRAGEVVADLKWPSGNRPGADSAYQGSFRDGGGPVAVQASFIGLLPEEITEAVSIDGQIPVADWPEIERLTDAIRGSLAGITYLGPFRQEPRRSYRFRGQPAHVGASGSRAPELLGADKVRMGGNVLKAVSAWYAEHLGGWRLDVSETGETFAVVLQSPDDPKMGINLVDTGAGLSQVLPLVVQRQFEAAGGQAAALEIIEQPELHLHPAAHGPLADLYVQALRATDSRFIIETHSENFVLRVRRRIADGTLTPDQVALYWVDDRERPGSTVVGIPIRDNGDVALWPPGVFAEDFDELKAIRAGRGRPPAR